MTKAQARKEIQKILDTNPHGPYSHNIVGLILSQFADSGKNSPNYKGANSLVDEFNLTSLYGINKVDPA